MFLHRQSRLHQTASHAGENAPICEIVWERVAVFTPQGVTDDSRWLSAQRYHRTITPTQSPFAPWKGARAPASGRVRWFCDPLAGSRMPSLVCPVVSLPLNHRLSSTTPAGVGMHTSTVQLHLVRGRPTPSNAQPPVKRALNLRHSPRIFRQPLPSPATGIG